MENQIEKIREDIRRDFDPDAVVDGSRRIKHSPNNKFRLELEDYRLNKPEDNWYVAKVEVFDNESNERLFELFADDNLFFHCWLSVDEIDYLVCAENMCGGQTVIDLTNRRMSSYADDTDGFIWTDFFLSPDGKTLATFGCFWAHPYEIKVYDFRDPMTLPLRELKSVTLGDDESMDRWLDDKSFITDGVNREYIEETREDGTVNYKEVAAEQIGRVICIDE